MRLLKCEAYINKVDCYTRDQIVQANPDIAGVGVIIGFLSTTCLAFLVAISVLFLDRYEKIVNLFRRNITKNEDVYEHDEKEAYWRSPTFWSRVLSKNLLALADTQLLTGLAIQFAAMLRHCDLSIYHFQIVTELAFLTTVTHLLTVVTLRNYFVKYKWINMPRIFFMLGNLALLGYTSFVSYSYDLAGLDLSTSLACFFQGERPPFRAAFGGKWAALLIGAIGGHVTVILAMYVLEDDNDNAKHQNTKKNSSKWSWLKWIGAIFRTWIVAPIYAIYGVYMAGSGLKDTQALGNPDVRMNGSEGDWGFGQFLPVLLLALPVFAGWESFWEEKDEDRENRFGPRGSQAGSRSALNMFDGQKSPKSHQRSRDTSVEERRIESSSRQRSASRVSVSPLDTPRQRSTSHISISPLPTPQFPSPLHTPQVPTSSPHLSPPLPSASPNIGQGRSSPAVNRSRSHSSFSKFEEHLP
ncbi:hypothetical protein K458DRAFT_56781 [Lentithecium fluviatile CBS 122367]|uniref:Uncharacterized protein n=1 Tax=Lentithecium fluviatile CBS 122367 TaxID=1168545 RepID=A0A6G1IXM7_9PLEO|nr:hypothetical protein K458DRAFT_56781 [Lentithecium fluviatile CBS 122367]